MADVVYPGSTAGGPLNSEALPENVDLIMYKGDYLELLLTLKDQTGTPLVITGFTPKAQLKTDYSDQGPTEFTCALTGSPGQIRISMASSVTSNLLPGSYIWDFQLTNTSSQTRTYLAGDVTVLNEVTT